MVLDRYYRRNLPINTEDFKFPMTVIHPSTKEELKKEYSLLGYLIMNNFSEKVLGTLTYFILDLNQEDSMGIRPLSYALWHENMVAIRLL
jgi:hypothetical protein